MEPLDKVKVTTSDSEFKGTVMPNETDALVLKLDSGYNIGIDKKKIKKSEVIKKAVKTDARKHPVKHSKKLPTIAVLHTGGTIASKVDYASGGVSAKFTASDLVEMFPELQKIANIETELVANMMSEDMHFSDHQKIARAILKWAKKGVKGIIVGHGTDTLHYTSASLSFMFEKINIPVLIVGSQRSSDRGSTDAAMNLICAANFIANTEWTGIATCLHDSSSDDECAIINGTKARKMHTSRRDAFWPINDRPIALVSMEKIDYLKEFVPEKGIVLKEKMSDDVGLLKTHPNIKKELFEFYAKTYKGIVIEGTGLGHAPTNTKENLPFYDILKKYIKDGGIVCMTSQCIMGRVHPSVYTNLRRLADIGVIFCEDMTAETAYIKLSWLMANHPDSIDMMTENLRGEINPRLEE